MKQDYGKLHVELAANGAELREAQALRYRVFTEEFGARLQGAEEQLDRDLYDPHCHHLLVRERDSGEVVGCTRILTDQRARDAGGFYSASEFDLGNIATLPGRIMEVGRTCVHPDYRRGATIGVLWAGVAGFIELHGFDHVIGCVSVGLADGGVQASSLLGKLGAHRVADEYSVTPLHPFQPINAQPLHPQRIPPLLKAYLRLGAKVSGEACLDPEFNVADLFVLLNVEQMNPSYRRHFIERNQGLDERRIA